jgi:hypothetical protein
MKIQESYDKEFCHECNEYGYVFEIYIGDDAEYPKLRLCKSCLLKLFDAIIRR